MKPSLFILALGLLAGCAAPPPPKLVWNTLTPANEQEYESYQKPGTGSLSGQAFFALQGGGVVKAAGRRVTLDPATAIGREWWTKAGRSYVYRMQVPPSPSFIQARRTTIADAEGRFHFSRLPSGSYYVRTDVTWEVGHSEPTQGGLVGRIAEVKDGEATEVVLNTYPR